MRQAFRHMHEGISSRRKEREIRLIYQEGYSKVYRTKHVCLAVWMKELCDLSSRCASASLSHSCDLFLSLSLCVCVCVTLRRRRGRRGRKKGKQEQTAQREGKRSSIIGIIISCCCCCCRQCSCFLRLFPILLFYPPVLSSCSLSHFLFPFLTHTRAHTLAMTL